MVVAPDGTLVDLLRVNDRPDEKQPDRSAEELHELIGAIDGMIDDPA